MGGSSTRVGAAVHALMVAGLLLAGPACTAASTEGPADAASGKNAPDAAPADGGIDSPAGDAAVATDAGEAAADYPSPVPNTMALAAVLPPYRWGQAVDMRRADAPQGEWHPLDLRSVYGGLDGHRDWSQRKWVFFVSLPGW